MPDKSKHEKQFKANKILIENPVFDINRTKHSDWLMTIIFYTAVHLVEKELAILEIDSENHVDREKKMHNLSKLKYVTTKYDVLRQQSQRARYQCAKFQKKDLEDALKYLRDIEKAVSN